MQIDNKVNIADKATSAEAQAGTDDAKWMTPLKTKQAILSRENLAKVDGEIYTLSSRNVIPYTQKHLMSEMSFKSGMIQVGNKFVWVYSEDRTTGEIVFNVADSYNYGIVSTTIVVSEYTSATTSWGITLAAFGTVSNMFYFSPAVNGVRTMWYATVSSNGTITGATKMNLSQSGDSGNSNLFENFGSQYTVEFNYKGGYLSAAKIYVMDNNALSVAPRVFTYPWGATVKTPSYATYAGIGNWFILFGIESGFNGYVGRLNLATGGSDAVSISLGSTASNPSLKVIYLLRNTSLNRLEGLLQYTRSDSSAGYRYLYVTSSGSVTVSSEMTTNPLATAMSSSYTTSIDKINNVMLSLNQTTGEFRITTLLNGHSSRVYKLPSYILWTSMPSPLKGTVNTYVVASSTTIGHAIANSTFTNIRFLEIPSNIFISSSTVSNGLAPTIMLENRYIISQYMNKIIWHDNNAAIFYGKK